MTLTKRQKDCIEKASQYRKNTFKSQPFAKQYIRFCDDGYVTPSQFKGFFVNKNNVFEMKTHTRDTTIDFNEYVEKAVAFATKERP